MATKVKGEAIKEGSIPLSALADDALNSIKDKYLVNIGNTTEEDRLGWQKICQDNSYYDNENKPLYHGICRLMPTVPDSTEIVFSYEVIEWDLAGIRVSGVLGSKLIQTTIATDDPDVAANSVKISPFADWNAQEGEAGYIENKPFGSIEYKSFEDSDAITINENQIIIRWPHFNAIKLNEDDYMYGADENGLIIFKNNEVYYTSQFDYDTQVFFNITYDSETQILTIDCDENISEYLKYIKPVSFKRIDADYVQDVLKTHPQTLSDTVKNQVLTNLGIDPVVWKYMCNPYGINVSEPIPDELDDIIYNTNDNGLVPIIKNVCYIKIDNDNIYYQYIVSVSTYDDCIYTVTESKEVFIYRYDHDSKSFYAIE